MRDLVAAIPNRAVKTAIDLGCGPGNSTEVLAAAFPDAKVTGLDNSPDMIAAARKRLPQSTSSSPTSPRGAIRVRSM